MRIMLKKSYKQEWRKYYIYFYFMFKMSFGFDFEINFIYLFDNFKYYFRRIAVFYHLKVLVFIVNWGEICHIFLILLEKKIQHQEIIIMWTKIYFITLDLEEKKIHIIRCIGPKRWAQRSVIGHRYLCQASQLGGLVELMSNVSEP